MMGSGRSVPGWTRAGWLAAIIIPLVLLVGASPSLWHGEHANEHECTVCHSGRQTADLSRSAEVAPAHVFVPIERAREVRRVPSRRSVRRPARAPPA